MTDPYQLVENVKGMDIEEVTKYPVEVLGVIEVMSTTILQLLEENRRLKDESERGDTFTDFLLFLRFQAIVVVVAILAAVLSSYFIG